MLEKVIVALTTWTLLVQVRNAIVLSRVLYKITGTNDIDPKINVAVSGVVADVGAYVTCVNGDSCIVVVSNVVAYVAVNASNNPRKIVAVGDVVADVTEIAYKDPSPIAEGKYPLDLATVTIRNINTPTKVPDCPITDDYVRAGRPSIRNSLVAPPIVTINRKSI